MRPEDVKIGMKVVPHSKSEGLSYGNWKKSSGLYKFFDRYGYLCVCDFFSNGNDVDYIVVSLSTSDNHEEDFDFFKASDFEPYQPEPKKIPFTVIMPL